MSIGDKLLKSAAAGGFTPSENFGITLYTGDSSTIDINTLGFQPDLIWTKCRDASYSNLLVDSTRGGGEDIRFNTSDAEATDANITCDSDGYNLNWSSTAQNGFQASGKLFVSYAWKANGGTTASNGLGSITSTVQANADAGFSIVQYGGTGSAATIGHGLSSAPEIIFSKQKTGSTDWVAGALDWTKYLEPNDTPAFRSASSVWNNTAPSSTVFSVAGSGGSNTSGGTNIAYCFHSVDSFSKIDSYEGNGDDYGTIVETGFEVSWILIKNVDSADNWVIFDNKRDTTNPREKILQANLDAVESTEAGAKVDFLANGFQLRGSGGGIGQTNTSGETYLYMAFATDPDTEQPTLADSFNAIAYSGDGGTNNITGYGFKPNFIWTKVRNATGQWSLFDSVRGPLYRLATNTDGAGSSVANTLTSFDDDGFTFGNEAGNNSGETYIAYGFKANDDVPTINEEGTVDSIVSVNANAGFSIVKFTTPASPGSATRVGHGLSAAPDYIIVKRTDGTEDWYVYHTSMGLSKAVRLNSNIAEASSTNLWNTVSATVFNPSFTGTGDMECIAYCWHSVTGYSSFGGYTGNATETTIATGFAPDLVYTKNIDDVDNWRLYDSVRQNAQPFDEILYPNLTDGEDDNTTGITGTTVSGFTLGTGNLSNDSGKEYIYIAFKIN